MLSGPMLGLLLGLAAALTLAAPSPRALADGYVSFGFGKSYGHRYYHRKPGYGYYKKRYRHYGHKAYRHKHRYRHRHYGYGHYHRHYGFYGNSYRRHGYLRKLHRRHRNYPYGYYDDAAPEPYPATPPVLKTAKPRKKIVPKVIEPRPRGAGPGHCRVVREYQTVIRVGGKEVPAYGDACLQADGSWHITPPKAVPD